MTEPIAISDLEAFVLLRKQAADFEEKISNRLDYVIRETFAKFGVKVLYWYINGADEGDGGDLLKAFRWDDQIGELCISWDDSTVNPNDLCIIDKNGCEFGFAEGEIPRRWLFEDFAEELTAGIRAYKEKQAAIKEKKKATRALKKAEKERLKASAAAKLSAAERKALGL